MRTLAVQTSQTVGGIVVGALLSIFVAGVVFWVSALWQSPRGWGEYHSLMPARLRAADALNAAYWAYPVGVAVGVMVVGRLADKRWPPLEQVVGALVGASVAFGVSWYLGRYATSEAYLRYYREPWQRWMPGLSLGIFTLGTPVLAAVGMALAGYQAERPQAEEK